MLNELLITPVINGYIVKEISTIERHAPDQSNICVFQDEDELGEFVTNFYKEQKSKKKG